MGRPYIRRPRGQTPVRIGGGASGRSINIDRVLSAANQGIEVEKAIHELDRLSAANPQNVDILLTRAHLRWAQLGEGAKAEKDLKTVLRLDPDNVMGLSNLAELLRRRGKREQAVAAAERCLALAPDHMGALATLTRARPASVDDGRIARLNDLASRTASRIDRSVINNLLGQVLEARGEHDQAFAYFAASNRDNPNRYERGAMERLASLALAEADAFVAPPEALAGRRPRRGPRYVFVVGMPRSGSTLCEQILLGAPKTASLGESGALHSIVREARGEARAEAPGRGAIAGTVAAAFQARIPPRLRGAGAYIDKTPLNFFHIGTIVGQFPTAKVIHTARHPLDACLSCFAQAFASGHGFSNDLKDLAEFYRLYHRVLARWLERADGLRTLRYETLVTTPAPVSRALVAAAGLDWHARSLAPEANDRIIFTSSASQANEPIHDLSVGRWRRYEAHLGPLIDGLGGMARVEAMERDLSRQAIE